MYNSFLRSNNENTKLHADHMTTIKPRETYSQRLRISSHYKCRTCL